MSRALQCKMFAYYTEDHVLQLGLKGGVTLHEVYLLLKPRLHA